MADLLSEQPGFELEEDESDEVPGMNMTPMVDVIFILLVFFLCVSQIKSGTFELELPKADTAAEKRQSKDQKKPVVVEIDKASKVAIDGVICPDSKSQRAAIKKIFEGRGKLQSILLRCDGKVNVSTLLPVQLMLSKQGFTRVEIEYDPNGGRS